MITAAAHRGPDARGVWTSGAIGLGHVLLRTGHTAAPQPFVVGDYGVVFDGRLDNRAEIESLLPDGAAGGLADDPAVVLAAYRAWGRDAFRRLLGDFSAALWDGPARRLVCARDIVGIKPLYYHATASLFVCGSEMQQLFAAADISAEPNPGMVAEYLCLRVVHSTDTLFRDVFRVPPGSGCSIQPRRRVRGPLPGDSDGRDPLPGAAGGTGGVLFERRSRLLRARLPGRTARAGGKAGRGWNRDAVDDRAG